MIQKAGSTDNTLGVNGWQSADHWIIANTEPGLKYEVGQMVWINLGPQILKHLSFANYRVSTLRDGGKVCMGVLSGGALSQRPDEAKRVAPAAVASSPLKGELPDLPDSFTKTHISLDSIPDIASRQTHTEVSDMEALPRVLNTGKSIDLPELPKVIEKPKNNEDPVSDKDDKAAKEKKSSTTLFAAIGFIALALVTGGYFLSRPASTAPTGNSGGESKLEDRSKPSSSSELPPELPAKISGPSSNPGPSPSLPKNPSSNNQRSSGGEPSAPDLNKIVKDAINK